MAAMDLLVGSMGWTSHGREGNLVQHGGHGLVCEDRHVLELTVRAVYPLHLRLSRNNDVNCMQSHTACYLILTVNCNGMQSGIGTVA